MPLAIQWTLGEYSKTRDLTAILSRALDPDSPLLEFSFRNSWNVLDDSARQALAVSSIFESPPTGQEWRTALDWSVERLDKAVTSLIEVTFVVERAEQTTGKVVYSALPITLNFARNELGKMRGLETQARLRYQNYRNRIELAAVETSQYSDLFERFEAKTEVQKRALVLCRMAEGQGTWLGFQAAIQYYNQALELDPRSVYALVSYGLFKSELGNYGEAIDLLNRATQSCTKKTGYWVYYSFSRVYDQVRDRTNRISCLRKALEYEPTHTIARHSLGVALSQSGHFDEALRIFDQIIEEELSRPQGPSESLAYAFKTKIITLRRAKRDVQAKEVLQSALLEVVKYEMTKNLVQSLHEMDD